MIFPPAVSGSVAVYEIQKSLRFRASASARLSRTPSTSSSRTTWTWSAWIKRGALSTSQPLFEAISASDAATRIILLSDNTIRVSNATVTNNILLQTSSVFRDASAHYHVQVVMDTLNATSTDRVRIYIDGSRITSFASATYPSSGQNTYINTSGVPNYIGGDASPFNQFFDGYLSEINFIDGQALTPADFGEFDINGVWVPKAYTGTYGTNGFYLPFSDGTSLSTLTADASGNGNNWTANNISLTAGTTYDWMDDTPTNNHATLNPLVAGAANITKANLASGTTAVRATFNALAINSYWEVTAGGSNVTGGVINDAGTTNTVTVTANKVFAFRLSTAGALDYRNVTDAGSWTSITSGLSGNQFPYGATAAADWNFGQRPFSGTVPDGYAKLCAAKIAAGSITTSGSFTGNANADGPFVWLNGVPTAMTINGNAVTFGTHADKTAGGFKVRSSSASYNAAGSNTYSITSTGAAFKNARAQVNP